MLNIVLLSICDQKERNLAKRKNIFLRGRIYWIRYSDINGNQRRESSESDKVGKATSLLRLRQGEVEKGELVDVVKIKNSTFKELAKEYLEFCAKQKNYRNTEIMINNFTLEFGNIPLRNFTTLLLEKYQSRLLSTPRPPLKGSIDPRPPVCTATIDRRIATIKSMFTKAVDWKMVPETVSKEVHKVKIFKKNRKRDRFLSTEEIKDLLDACDSNLITITGKTIKNKQDHLKPVIIFALTTGCRKDEILSLKWDDVDIKHGFVKIQETKNGESRQIKLNDTLKETLENIQKFNDFPYVFNEPDKKYKIEGRRKRFGDVKRSFATACRKAGISGATFHSLRHTFASHLVMNGIDLTTVSRLLGHKSLTMTLRYAHLAPNHLDKAVNSLNAVIGILKNDAPGEISTEKAQSKEKGLRLIA